MRKIYSCIDIGSNSIKIVVSEYFNKKYNILASISYPTESIKKGVVINNEMFVNELKQSFKEIKDSLGLKIDKVITNVPIYNAVYTLVEGDCEVSNSNNIVNGNDMVDALENAIEGKIDKQSELVTIIPIKYILDDDEKLVVKEPRGLQAKRIKVYAMMITVPRKKIFEIVTGIEKVGVEVVDILFGSIGDYEIFKEPDYDEKTIGVINLGTDKIELSIFNNGIVTNSTIIQDGARTIDSDIAYVYNIKKSQAKRIKEIFALADTEYASQSEIYEITNKSNMKTKISQYEVSKIISNKIKEMLQSSKKEINHLTKKEISYIIITGGISNIPGFENIAKEVFGEIYVPKKLDLIGIRDNSYSSAIGMIMYFVNKLKIRGKAYSMFDEEKQVDLVDVRKNENMFGRIFDYLIGSKEE